MFTFNVALVLAFAGAANAHFRLLYPQPRGEFVSAQEPFFCANVWLSTAQNANSFETFNLSNGTQRVVADYPHYHNGTHCLPINLTTSNFDGVADGANVTIQFVFKEKDTNLYQCADLTLSKDFTIPSDATCPETSNSHDDHDHDDHDHDHSEESNSTSGSSDSTSGALRQTVFIPALGAILAGVIGLIV